MSHITARPRQARRQGSQPQPRRWIAAGFIGLLTFCAALLGGASSASAAIVLGAGPNIPTPNGPVVVGQSYPSSLRLINNSDDSQGNDPIRLDTITLVPSCGVVASVNCPTFGFGGNAAVSAFDPDVFALSATGTGRTGTACATKVFNINNVSQAQDKYEFVPANPATPVVLGPPAVDASDECIIDFTAQVLKVPTKDAKPDTGVQTNELAGVNGTSEVDGQVGSGDGSNFTTVNKIPVAISTQVTPATITLGAAFRDTATLAAPAGGPVPTGSVTFNVYDNATCTGTPRFTSTNALNGTSATVSSDEFRPTAAGRYQVIAIYSGDTTYASATSLCDDPKEVVVVTSSTPPPPPPPPPPTTVTPPPPPPPAQGVASTTPPYPCVPAPGPVPAGAPEGTKLCARGTAAIKGPTSCAGRPFSVVVSGRQIQRVIFTVDGKVVRTLTKPNSGNRYTLAVNPRTYGAGTHRVLARTTFRKQSGSKARTLRTAFTRCSRRSSLPAFTG